MVAFHGPMLENCLSRGEARYDRASFLNALTRPAPLGELAPAGLEALRSGEARGMLLGGTVTQLLAGFGEQIGAWRLDGMAVPAARYLEQRGRARLLQARDMFRHVVPNILAVVFVQITLVLAFAMLVEASLSFLGLGVQPPAASWGSMLNGNKASLQQGPWASLLPGLCIMLAVLGFNLLGDGLRDTLDPSLRRSN